MYLGLGTNLGDRAANLARALRALDRVTQVDAVSDVYESDPWGFTRQPVFWNMAARVTTSSSPLEFLQVLQQVEREAGRRRTFRMGPRIIDIDILLWEDLIVREDVLTIPHPGVHERAFVLRPLLDIEPDAVHPVTGGRLDEHMAQLGPHRLRCIGAALRVLGEWKDAR